MSIREDLWDRQYINFDKLFEFPQKQELKLRLKDVLEEKVDEKYYLSDERVANIRIWENRQKENGRGFRFDIKGGDSIGRAITTSGDRPSTSNYYAESSGGGYQ